MRSTHIGLCFLVCLALSMSLVYAGQMGIGVEPTIVDVYLNNENSMTVLPIKVSNPSEQDMIFQFSIDAELDGYIEQDCVHNYYWCNEDEYFVPAHTELKDGTVVNILFKMNGDEPAEFESGIYIQGKPTELPEGMIVVTPRIKVRTTVHQTILPTTTTTTTTTVPASNGGDSGSIVITHETTTTTTTLPEGSSDAVIVINPDRSSTTTTIDKEEEVAESGIVPIIIVIIVIGVAGGLGLYYFKDKLIFVLPFLLIFSMIPLAHASDIFMNVTVGTTTTTTTTTTIPAPPVQPYQLAVGSVAVFILAGFILWFLRTAIVDLSIERVVGIILSAIIVIALVGAVVLLI